MSSQATFVAGDATAHCAKRGASFSKMTLGGLASELFNSVVVDARESVKEGLIDATETRLSARVQYTIVMDAEKLAATQTAVHDMVQLRNGLVHHFIERFDLRSEDGCVNANEFLVAAFSAVDERVRELAGWAKAMDAARVHAAAVVSSPEFENLIVNGIQPNGDVVWECSGIVSGLCEAFEQLSTDGWMSLEAACNWMSTNEPDQLPERYGCVSWKELVHKSKRFRMSYRIVSNGPRVAGVEMVGA